MTWMQRVRDGNLVSPIQKPGYRYRFWDIALALIYGTWETAYFGWNLTPQSGAEMACDGIALLLIILACRPVHTSGDT